MRSRHAFLRPQVVAVLVLIALAAGFTWMSANNLQTQAKQESLDRTLSNFLSNLAPMNKLDPIYEDADGDLLPDSPKDDSLCVTPTELMFSFIATEDPTNESEVWKSVMEALESGSGLTVKYLKLTSPKDQLQALRNGKLHVTAFSTGEVPTAVNSCGFIPVCTTGREDDSFGYNMQFVVKADSPIKKLTDLKGKKVIFTRPRSNSGYKAAMVELMDTHKMLPERDYYWSFSYGHLASIDAVGSGEHDAAPVASDVFEREASKGELKAEDFRVIYESEKFPPLAFGYAYNLAPEIRESISKALLELDWAGTTLEKEFGGDGSNKFVALSYKDNWANIRRIDQAAKEAKQDILSR